MNGQDSLEKRPGIFFLGSPNVGKRSLISRLIGLDFDEASDSSSSQLVVNGWNISTKYYTADVSVWMAHLHDEFSIDTLPMYDQLQALIMVFDTTELSSLSALQKWVSRTDLQKFDILLCVGNKVDLVPGHPVHAEYRRRLQKLGDDPFGDSGPWFADYGISETEGSSLLGDDEPSWEAKQSWLEWCTEHNIEYIEACASNADFDKCLSIDGDSQGVERLLGALSAHMWPGMILKSGDKISEPSLPEREEDLSGEESDYEFEYEVLSAGAEPFDDMENGWVSANCFAGTSDLKKLAAKYNIDPEGSREYGISSDKEEPQTSTSTATLHEDTKNGVVSNAEEPDQGTELDQAQGPDEGTLFEFEDLEQLMSEIGNMRDSLRLMPDFQRRDMAAKLALKMATMFGGSSDDEVEV